MKGQKSDKPEAVIRGLIIFSKNDRTGHIAIQNCSIEDIADCILCAFACLYERKLNSSQILSLLDARAKETNINWKRQSK